MKEKVKLKKKKKKGRKVEGGKGRGHVPMVLMSADEHRNTREAMSVWRLEIQGNVTHEKSER